MKRADIWLMVGAYILAAVMLVVVGVDFGMRGGFL